MSDTSGSPASVSGNPQLSQILEESEGFETSTTPTAPTVITKFASTDKIYDPHDPNQSFPSHKFPLEVAEAEEEYFSFDRLIQENPNLSWAAAVDDKKYDLHDPDQSIPSLPSHLSPTVEIAEAGEEYFSFDRLVQENPNLSWAAVVEDERHELHDLDQSLQLQQQPHVSPTIEVPEEEYFTFDKCLKENPDLSWAAYSEGTKEQMRERGRQEEPVAATMSPSTLPARHSAQAAVTPASGSSSSDSLMRALLRPPTPMRVLEPQKARPLSISLFHTSSEGETGRQEEPVAATMSLFTLPARLSAQAAVTPASDSSSSDSLMRALLRPPTPMRVLEPRKARPSSISLFHATSEGERGRQEEPVAATMSPSSLPARHSAQAAVTPASDSSSSDSLIRSLLQPPVPMRVVEPRKARPSLTSLSYATSKGERGRQEEPVAATMSPSTLPARLSAQAAVTPISDTSSNLQDSFTRTLLQWHPSIRASELRTGSPSSLALTEASSKEEETFQRQLMETGFLAGSSPSTEGSSSPQRRSKRRRSEFGSSSQSSSAEDDISTPHRLIDTGLGDLDAKTALFLARQLSPPIMHKPRAQQRFFTDKIDPYAVGLATMHEVLRDGAYLTKELRSDAQAIGRRRPREPCVCDVTRHPSWWPVDRVQDVHNYSFLLDCEDLVLSRDTLVAANKTETIMVYDVPMERNNPVKFKAEQVLRFVDVEVGYGDRTCDNLYYYYQPPNRKVLLMVTNKRVVGIVVAEELRFAHRILRETSSYMNLEEDPVSVRVGINRLWVHISMRRKHLASILCQLIGNYFYENETLRAEDYAFNNISDAMVMFAKVFLKTLRPPLYTRLK